MRIALISTCAVSVPPKAYGGTELVIAELAKNLTRLGHDVTVYATGDSRPAARLEYRFARAVWPPDDLAELRHAAFAWHLACAESPPFDLVHAHQAQSLAFSAVCPLPVVVTLHHQRHEALLQYYLDFPRARYVAISRRQADLCPELAVRDVVHHGLDLDIYPAGQGGGGYVAFLGRLAEEKAPHVAIDAAMNAGVPIKIAGVPHPPDHAYFEREVRPRLSSSRDRVEWLGEVSLAPKIALLSRARALLFPIAWEEPFGLAMIESMLVGTPVIAFARGSAPEVVDEGVTGYLVHTMNEMRERITAIDRIDRDACRARARERWSSLRMAREYERIYLDVLEAVRARRAARPSHPREWGLRSHQR